MWTTYTIFGHSIHIGHPYIYIYVERALSVQYFVPPNHTKSFQTICVVESYNYVVTLLKNRNVPAGLLTSPNAFEKRVYTMHCASCPFTRYNSLCIVFACGFWGKSLAFIFSVENSTLLKLIHHYLDPTRKMLVIIENLYWPITLFRGISPQVFKINQAS